MATNMVYEKGDELSYAASALTPSSGVESGDPVLAGQVPGVALIDETDSKVTVKHNGVFDLEAEAVDNAGNSAIAVGDILYYDSAATIKINKDATNGVRFGYALEAIGSGNSDTIYVKVGY